ncbi:MAG: lysylphosphatidylglycerol synthase transmembrane domain-containing protein, partial [Bacteroidota bacterium]
MNLKPASIIRFLLLLVAAGALLFFAFRGMRLSLILQEMLKANFFWLLFSVVISVAALFSRAYRWKLLIEPLGYSPPLRRTFYALMVGYFANLAFPRLGEVTRCGSLNKTESIPFSSLLGTVIVERAVDVISLLICIVLTVIIEYKTLGNYLVLKVINPIFEKLKHSFNSPLFVTGVLVFVVLAFFGVRYFIKRAKLKETKIAHFINELIKGLKSIANLKHPWQFIFHSVL